MSGKEHSKRKGTCKGPGAGVSLMGIEAQQGGLVSRGEWAGRFSGDEVSVI